MPIVHSIGSIFLPGQDLTYFKAFVMGVASLGAITTGTDYIGYRKNIEFGDIFKTLNPYACAILAVVFYFGITLLAKREGAQFIYFQF
jgi:hypothetical protein